MDYWVSLVSDICSGEQNTLIIELFMFSVFVVGPEPGCILPISSRCNLPDNIPY